MLAAWGATFGIIIRSGGLFWQVWMGCGRTRVCSSCTSLITSSSLFAHEEIAMLHMQTRLYSPPSFSSSNIVFVCALFGERRRRWSKDLLSWGLIPAKAFLCVRCLFADYPDFITSDANYLSSWNWLSSGWQGMASCQYCSDANKSFSTARILLKDSPRDYYYLCSSSRDLVLSQEPQMEWDGQLVANINI